jgi:glycosyltransferase involved in cell wall biosynthesis
LEDLRPDIIHLHHYVHFGVEMLYQIKKILPDAKIVITLHEYLAICHHFGQMVKKGSYNLCYRASPQDCSRCFPEIDPSDFFLREKFIKMFFDLVDHFISPSHFLADRYVTWGVDKGRISVIENIIASSLIPGGMPLAKSEVLKVGFFGQISKLKGIEVLLNCAALLAEDPDAKVHFDIYGDYHSQPQEFQTAFLTQLEKAGANVSYHGAYQQTQVDRLMCGVDVVLVPSIWWENSPVVIQEALRNRRPVVCSNIGGMAEKVRDGVDGWHFAAGNSIDLSITLKNIADNRNNIENLMNKMASPPSRSDIVQAHMLEYQRLLSS